MYNDSKKIIVLLALIIVSNVTKGFAEEVVGTILFEPKETYYGYQYLLSTGNSKIADKVMDMSSGNIGGAMDVLPYYLVKGAKIVYENKGMQNRVGEQVHPNRLLAIITEDGTRIEIDELASDWDIGYYFRYFYEKLKAEGRVGR